MLRDFLRRLVPAAPAGGDARRRADRLIEEGRAAEAAGDMVRAADKYREAVALAADYPATHLNLGFSQEALGDPEGAMRSYEAVIGLDPAHPFGNYNLGKLALVQGRHADARRHLLRALESKPDFAEAQVVLASVYEAQGEYPGAASALEAALRQQPDNAGFLLNCANVLVKLDRMAEAETSARRATQSDPQFRDAWMFLGDLLRSDGRVDEAAEMFARASELPGDRLACEQAQLHALNHSDAISDQALFERHRAVGRRIEAAYPARFVPFANHKDPERRLKIGYVSRDLFRHPVGWFLAPVLERHDRAKFEVHCYATSRVEDDMTATLRALSDRWIDLWGKTHAAKADAIQADGIDILVDLLGHASTSNLAMFAQQPAPVQVSWLGYLATTGMTRIQYRLCDGISDPSGVAELVHTEKLVRLPHGQWCYRPYRESEFSKTHAQEPPCTRNGFVTFGSFNHCVKLSPTSLALWARILGRVVGSRLVVVGVPPGPATERVLSAMTQGGVDASRVRIVPPLPMEDYFRTFDEVDIALDSTPYSGGTTTCDTLWMGVPVVTLAGTRSVSRSAASLLATIGLPEWIADSPEAYVDRAAAFAADRSLLAALRATLRQRMRASPLMDEPRFVHDLEAAYRQVWRTWCEQERSSAMG